MLLKYLSRLPYTKNPVQWQQNIRCMCTHSEIKLVNKAPLTISISPPDQGKKIGFEIDWDEEMASIYQEEKEQQRSILAPVEDESKIYAEPMLRPTFTLAGYVQKSETLQKMLALGVNLYKIEMAGHGQYVVGLDFERDIQPYYVLLTKDIGLDAENFGEFLSKNVLILKESLDDIRTRIHYLQLKRFSQENIVSIITRNPKWLSYSTKEIDRRLGYFQSLFKFTGDELRLLTLDTPKLITSDLDNIRENHFTIREEFCYENNDDVKQIVLKCPKLLMLGKFNIKVLIFRVIIQPFFSDRYNLVDRYDYVSRVMKIDNEQIAMDPYILKNRMFRIKERHGFLKSIGRAQYNRKLELYIPLSELCKGSNEEFAENIAKRPYEEFDAYLRTL